MTNFSDHGFLILLLPAVKDLMILLVGVQCFYHGRVSWWRELNSTKDIAMKSRN